MRNVTGDARGMHLRFRSGVLSSRFPRGCQARRFAETWFGIGCESLRIGMPGTSAERAHTPALLCPSAPPRLFLRQCQPPKTLNVKGMCYEQRPWIHLE